MPKSQDEYMVQSTTLPHLEVEIPASHISRLRRLIGAASELSLLISSNFVTTDNAKLHSKALLQMLVPDPKQFKLRKLSVMFSKSPFDAVLVKTELQLATGFYMFTFMTEMETSRKGNTIFKTTQFATIRVKMQPMDNLKFEDHPQNNANFPRLPVKSLPVDDRPDAYSAPKEPELFEELEPIYVKVPKSTIDGLKRESEMARLVKLLDFKKHGLDKYSAVTLKSISGNFEEYAIVASLVVKGDCGLSDYRVQNVYLYYAS